MKVPFATVPVLIVGITVVALLSTGLFAIPTVTVEFEAGSEARGKPTQVTEMIVSGVKCKDTALRVANVLADEPGILQYVAYASYNRIEITFLPDMKSIADIQALIEGPVYVEATGEFLFNLYEVIEVDGSKL